MSEFEFDWAGWVCAFVSFGGPFCNGYVGRVVEERGSWIKLADAYEYVSVTQYNGPQSTRSMTGSPIEFTALKVVEVNWVALLRLEGLDEKDMRPFVGTRREAKEKLRNMTPGAQRLVQPASALPVSGNGTRRIM